MDDCAEPPNWGKEDETPKPAAAKPVASQPSPRTRPAASDDGEGGSPARAVKSALPKDVAEWTPNDFQDAQRENDPRLIEAVVYLGKHFCHERERRVAGELLEPPSASMRLPHVWRPVRR